MLQSLRTFRTPSFVRGTRNKDKGRNGLDMVESLLTVTIYFFIFIIGASIFSFVNVLIYRVPREMPFGNERSICPSCGNTLKGYDMIPVLSWVILGGKCRFCKSRIAIRYPLVELLGGILAVFAMYWFGREEGVGLFVLGKVVLIIILLGILTAVTFVDIEFMEIPNGFVLAVAVCAVIACFLFPETGLVERLIGSFAVSVPLLLIAIAIPGAFGGGDIKLMAAAGLFLGWKQVIVALLIAILTGGFYGIYLLAAKKKERKDHFAFGPFLCAGIAVAVFAGTQLMEWYLGLLTL